MVSSIFYKIRQDPYFFNFVVHIFCKSQFYRIYFLPFDLGLIGWGFCEMADFFLFLDGFWLAGFVVWEEKQEGGASEMQIYIISIIQQR